MILKLFNAGEIFTKFLSWIFLTVAMVYDGMVSYTKMLTGSQILNEEIGNIIKNVYTLIAVFMLFRITVTMFGYLIDPDKLNDKQTGTGKMLTRIVISLILVIGFPVVMDTVISPLEEAILNPSDGKSVLYTLFNPQNNKTNVDSSKEYTAGVAFAREMVASLSKNPDEILESDFLITKEGNDDISRKVEEEEISIDIFMGILCGVALCVLLAVLCIEVVIRNFKLLILRVLSPVAFISYINPNDKVLNNWTSKFIGCYLDLFVKILGINMAIYFIGLLNDSVTGFNKLLLYFGAFVFAKTVPNFISEIFGIKNMGGTFKDSMSALKTAAVASVGTAGAFVTAVNGGTIGQIFTVLNSGFSGKLGNVGKSFNSSNTAVAKRKAEGIGWRDTQKDEIQNKFPWIKSATQHKDAAKSAGDNYKALDGALDGSVFSSDKSMQQLQNIYDSGTLEEKFAYANAFGMTGEKLQKFNETEDTSEKLRMLDEAWGEKKGLARASQLIEAKEAFLNGNANAFQQNIVTLASRLDASEKFVGVAPSRVSTVQAKDKTDKAKQEAIQDAAIALKIAKEHNKSGYDPKTKTPTESKRDSKKSK